MSNDAASIINNNDQYEYGFHDNVEPEYSTGRGLTEETVRKISAAKHEPQWMLDYRLKAYKIYKELPMPKFGPDLSELDLKNMLYYQKMTDKKFRDWDEVPLAVAGFALMTASISVRRLAPSCSSVKEALPSGQWIIAVLSTRYSTLPALISLMALVRSMVTVPVLGLGIRPLGPSTRPRRPTTPIMSGVATQTSKPNQPP